MVRTYWNATLVAALAPPALVWGQQASTPKPVAAPAAEQLISVKEAGKPEQRCRVLKVWKTAEGSIAREVQALDTGEIMTIVEIGPGTASPGAVSAPPAPHGVITRIFHWGHNNQTPPPGVPAPPTSGSTIVSSTPCTSCTPSSTVVSGPCPCQAGKPGTTVVSGPCSSCTAPGTTVVSGPYSSGSSGATVSNQATPGGTTVVTTAPAAEHAPFWKRWFQHEPYQIPAQPPASMAKYTLSGSAQTAVAQTPTKPQDGSSTVSTTPAKKVDAPQPTDWRRSWGKPDASQPQSTDSKTASQTPAKPATDTKTASQPKTNTDSKTASQTKTDSKAVAQTPAKLPDEKPDTLTKPSKAEVATNSKPTTPGKEAPGSVKGSSGMDLPRADSSKTDPLNTPDRFVSKQLATKLKDPSSGPDAKKTADKTKKTEVVTKKAPEKTATAAVSDAPGSSSTHPNLPIGAQSVLAAYEGKPGAVCYLPVPIVTLPESAPPGMTPAPAAGAKAPVAETTKHDDAPFNAFTPGSSDQHTAQVIANAFSGSSAEQQPPTGYAQGGQMMSPPPGMMPPGMMPPGMMPPGMMPPAMAMAMMSGGPRPAMPGSIAQTGYMPGPNGMLPPYMAAANAVAYCPPGMTNSAAYPAPPAPAEMQNVSQLLLTMRDSVYPSYREWAAEALTANSYNRHNPHVIDALMAGAKDDPAASVRAACVRCLAKMGINTAPAVTIIQGLKSDPDPRVRTASQQALTSMGIPQAPESPVLPAGATVPADKSSAPAGGIGTTEEKKEE